MAIDTAQKRMSVFELPSLMTNPFPAGTNTAADRQQMSDVYSGIAAHVVAASNTTCWTPSIQNTSSWVNSKRNTNTWVSERSQTKTWVPEKEVVPCGD